MKMTLPPPSPQEEKETARSKYPPRIFALISVQTETQRKRGHFHQTEGLLQSISHLYLLLLEIKGGGGGRYRCFI